MANEDTLQQMSDVARLQHFKQKGQGFVASESADVTSSGTLTLHLKNPSGNAFDIDVVQFLFSSQFKGQLKIYDRFSSGPSGGTSVGIDNLVADSGAANADTGTMTANTGVTFTADGTAHYNAALPSGGSGANGIGGAATATEPIIEPGREVVLELQNDSNSTAPGSVGAVYLEREDL